jgi:hypothetical protein
MSARRWSVLLGFTLVNLLFSVGWFVWAAIDAPPGNRMAAMGLTGILQLVELPLAYYLLRLSEYARDWTLTICLMKLVSAVGLGGGLVAGVGPVAGAGAAAAAVAITGFYAAFALFLRANAEFFD